MTVTLLQDTVEEELQLHAWRERRRRQRGRAYTVPSAPSVSRVRPSPAVECYGLTKCYGFMVCESAAGEAGLPERALRPHAAAPVACERRGQERGHERAKTRLPV